MMMFFSVTFSFLYYDKIERSNQKEKSVTTIATASFLDILKLCM